MKYYVHCNYQNVATTIKEFNSRYDASKYINDGLNGNPNRSLKDYTVIQGNTLLVETKEVITKKATIIGGQGDSV